MRGDGPPGALAVRRIEQVGRAGADAIHFHDRRTEDEVLGGAIAVEGGEEIALDAGTAAEVWVTAAAMERAGAWPSADVLDRAQAAALETSGFTRTVSAALSVGDIVFVRRPDTPSSTLLVAMVDPRRLLARKAALGVAFVFAAVVVAAGGTALALSPPVFGTLSKLGAVACLGLFLAVQPAGTRVRDALLVPGRLPLGGRWALHRGDASASSPPRLEAKQRA